MKDKPGTLETVYRYHDQTKHRFHSYAKSLGYMDWDSQPNPFRRYDSAEKIVLDHPKITATPTYDSLFDTKLKPCAPMNRQSISRLFYESLAISAWKQAGENRWSLRVNPSSGDLHPTEAYLISGPIQGMCEEAAVYHYTAYEHALERRTNLTHDEWGAIRNKRPTNFILLALTSIYWRESWKYGERAFRYCHHDVGHAIGAIAFAAATLGWKTKLIDQVQDTQLSAVIGLKPSTDTEAEHPDCLLAIFAPETSSETTDPVVKFPDFLIDRLKTAEFEGQANQLSRYHHDWPEIDMIAEACRTQPPVTEGDKQSFVNPHANDNSLENDRMVSARGIIRRRRSALAMDSQVSLDRTAFYRMMARVVPSLNNPVISVLPWRSRVSLALFIHRVDGLAPGLYVLVRDPAHLDSLNKALSDDLYWQKPENCPDFLNFFLLAPADMRDYARIICCHQNIAADGIFALAMLAEFEDSLNAAGAAFYPRLFWETGLIGQILYLEAEAAGIRSTGIGCFFDDAMHEALGISDHSWQSLYHFTVGGGLEDSRLQTLPSYWHLQQYNKK